MLDTGYSNPLEAAAALLERAVELLAQNNALLACAQASQALDFLHLKLREIELASLADSWDS